MIKDDDGYVTLDPLELKELYECYHDLVYALEDETKYKFEDLFGDEGAEWIRKWDATLKELIK